MDWSVCKKVVWTLACVFSVFTCGRETSMWPGMQMGVCTFMNGRSLVIGT